jgi:hypothetical protein
MGKEIGVRKITLEAHLRMRAEESETTKELESVFEIQKSKMEKYLITVLATFPTYSIHDANHSKSIVTAIENILGQEIIERLSGIDTFLLLMSAYMHDIGMIYTEKELRDVWDSAPFKEYLDRDDHSDDVKKAIAIVRAKDSRLFEDSFWQLEVRRSISIIMMDYYRPQHASRIDTCSDPSKSNIAQFVALDDTFLPNRIIKMIFKICKAHAMDFKEMMNELVKEDTYAGETFHPRMIAAMLRLGDLCDLDNDRFNNVAILVFGSLGEENLAHYFKHKSIETLHISRELIHIVADISKTDLKTECTEKWFKEEEDVSEIAERIYQNTIREHIRWKSAMQDEILNLKQNVNALFPVEWSFVVPELIYEVKLNGEPVVTSEQNLKFDFSQKRAFKLIEDISIYRTQKFIFIRELIQNAIDASKIQLWREIRDRYKEDDLKSPFTLGRQEVDIYERFKIEIRVSYNEKKNKILFAFEDHGIGISRDEHFDDGPELAGTRGVQRRTE